MLEAKNIRRTKNSVPVLSRNEIDRLGEEIIQMVCPKLLTQPAAFDIEHFTEIEMNLAIDYVFLSHCQCYLGMMAFDDIVHPIWNPETKRAEYLKISAGTVLIDNSLLAENQEHRFRFTLAHEVAGHAFLHRPYYHQDRDQLSFFDDVISVSPCRKPGSYINIHGSDDISWMEWQADCMAAAVLMPRSASVILLNEARNQFGYQRSFSSYNLFSDHYAHLLSDTFNVSMEAARIRAEQINPNYGNQPFI